MTYVWKRKTFHPLMTMKFLLLKKEVQRSRWSDFVGRQKTFQFTGAHEIQVPVFEEVTPYEVWNMFVDNSIMKHLVEQTNLYVRQQKEKRMQPNSRRRLTPNSRLQQWVDTNEAELKKF